MKKVFRVYTELKKNTLVGSSWEITLFAENILSAIEKGQSCMSNDSHVIKAKLLCMVDEDSDLEKYKDE